MISCEKSNSKAETVGINQWDRNDERNMGIEADELVGAFCGVMLRRIHYRDPADEKLYVFMTSEMTLTVAGRFFGGTMTSLCVRP
jgi:hypothetical protein